MATQQIETATVTCTAPVNIAVIKYWGKRNEELILPTNSSLSVTLHQNELKTTTTVSISSEYDEDKVWLNDREESINNPRLQRCLKEIRTSALASSSLSHELVQSGKVHIQSYNNFPTAAGLASSAAGYACLVYTLGQLYGYKGELSTIARQGSGSACRSMYGGFVTWLRGEREDGSDSLAIQVAPHTHWPELQVIILVVSDQKKPVSSTLGMRTTVQTSSLLKHRADIIVPQRMREMEAAIKNKDFEAFGRLTMQDSNQFHAVCLDTYPPICYLNDTSKQIIQQVTRYNEISGQVKAAYTFDAGPNAVLFTLSENTHELLSVILHAFPPSSDQRSSYVRGLTSSVEELADIKEVECFTKFLIQDLTDKISQSSSIGALKYIIHTKAGPGPQLLED